MGAGVRRKRRRRDEVTRVARYREIPRVLDKGDQSGRDLPYHESYQATWEDGRDLEAVRKKGETPLFRERKKLERSVRDPP